MDVQLGITLSLHDLSTLQKISEGKVAEKVREILNSFDMNQVEEHFRTQKTTCNIDLAAAQRVKTLADKLGAQPGRLARAIIEAHLHSIH